MAHVFVVSYSSFNTHLKYLFAGIGNKYIDIDYSNVDRLMDLHHKREDTYIGMLADISRVRIGDKVIFYLQSGNNKEGIFFGSFRVTERVFCESFANGNFYLDNELGMKLPLRVRIEPFEVYSVGATERECLDSLKDITRPCDLAWSLIYRKLTGNRGCTMIGDNEYLHIMERIRQRNGVLLDNTRPIQFDVATSTLHNSEAMYNYDGNPIPNAFSILSTRFGLGRYREIHIQAYLTNMIDEINAFRIGASGKATLN